MPRRPRTVRYTDEDGNTVPPGELTAEQIAAISDDNERKRAESAAELARLDDAEDGAYFRAVEELQHTEGVHFVISRVKPADKSGYCGKLTAEDTTMERIKSMWGPGVYRVRAQGPQGFVAGGGTITIAEDAIPSRGESSTLSILELMDKRDRENSEQKRERNMEYARILAPVFAALIPRLLGGNDNTAALITALKPPPPPSMSDVVQTMASMQALNGNSNKQSEMDIFMRALEFAKDINRTETNWIDVVKEVASPLLGTMAAGAPRIQGAIPSGAVNPNLKIESHGATDVNILQRLQFLRGTIDQLIVQASRGKDPELYAEVLLDNIPEDVPVGQLLGWLERTDWWQQMCKFHKGVEPFKSWFEKLRENVLRFLKEETDSSETVQGDQ